MMTIENWSLVVDRGDRILYGVDAYSEHADKRLSGLIHGDTRENYSDGSQILTSTIKVRDGDCIITKSGSRYLLGKISADHESHFPNQKARLLEALPNFSI